MQIIVSEFNKQQQYFPIVLLIVDTLSKILLKSLLNLSSLLVCLRMKKCWQFIFHYYD